MSVRVPRGPTDDVIKRFVEALESYNADHARARIDVYRQNPVSVRVRIIDPDFAGRNKIERNNEAWRYLNALPDEVQSDLSSLILLTPDETRMSFANLEFEDPTPSNL